MNVFDPNIHIQSVTVVGVGGTGAQVARIAARILYDMRRQRLHMPKLVLIDPDRVEEKNVGRQAFFAPSDIGHYKAEVVGKRLNLALGLDTAWIAEPVNAERHFDRYGSLVISCVDNHFARHELNHVPGCAIAAGNDRLSGQVCIGNCADRELMLRQLDGRDGKYVYLPHESLLFPTLLEPDPESVPQEQTVSCAELVALGAQSLLINDWIACVVGNYLYALLYRRPITSFLTFVHCDGMPAVKSVPICRSELEAYLDHAAVTPESRQPDA
ncbi:MAG: ThiF family adenylyltransferase [Anaerolinea sp.]|nr:ThiF family adenylyltransferase [Anaerolinea sp.]